MVTGFLSKRLLSFDVRTDSQSRMTVQFRWIGAVLLVGVSVAGADSIKASSLRFQYQKYEPIVVSVTLTRDAHADDPAAPIASGESKAIPCHLDAELWNQRERISTALLGGGGFGRVERRGRVHTATMIGLLGTLVRQGNDSAFELWGQPGEYRLVVVDQDRGLRSEPVRISILESDPELADAAELFASGGIRLLMAFQSAEHINDASELLTRLDKLAPNSAFGNYAGVLLALGKCENRHPRPGPPHPICGPEDLGELDHRAREFPVGHPLRSRALLTVAERAGGVGTEKLQDGAIRELTNESTDGLFRNSAVDLWGKIKQGREPASR